MTSKTRGKKRQAILNTAIQVFKEMGFHNASMNVIAARVGGSKSTLYNHFPSKEAIFLEIIRNIAKVQSLNADSLASADISLLSEEAKNNIDEAYRILQTPPKDVKATLQLFGENFISFLYTPEILAIRRLLLSELKESEIGEFYYQNGPRYTFLLISSYLEKAMDAGLLKKSDPLIAASHLRSLLESGLYEYFLLSKEEKLSIEEIRKQVAAAVNTFLTGYQS